MGTLPGESIWVSNNPVQLFQRGPGNRSPIESPPAAKKPLKSTSLSVGSSMPAAGVQFMQAAATAANVSAPGKENRSILKRMGAAGGPKSSRSWYGAGPGGSPTRKVNFELSVDVLVFDPVDGDYVCSESQRLNVEPTKDRREFVARTLLGRLNQRHGPAPKDRRPTAASSTDAASAGRPLPSIASTTVGSSSPTSAYPPADIDFSFYEDPTGRLRIKFTVPLGPGVAAGDALVKANVAGNKVRVLGTRTLPSDDPRSSAPERQEFASRYSLPMDVDPYAITARMDGSGNLFVEAPVVTPAERRPAPAAAAVEKATPRSSSSTLQPVAGARFA